MGRAVRFCLILCSPQFPPDHCPSGRLQAKHAEETATLSSQLRAAQSGSLQVAAEEAREQLHQREEQLQLREGELRRLERELEETRASLQVGGPIARQAVALCCMNCMAR